MSSSRSQSGAVVLKKLFVDNVGKFAALKVKLGQVITARGHTNNNVGGGSFSVVPSAGLTPDNGSVFATGSAGFYVVRRGPKKTPYEFGFIDGGVDASAAINACTAAYGACYLDGGKTYNIQYSVKPRTLKAIGGKATFNCTSPTANTRFGTTGAAIFCSPNATFGDTTMTGLLKGVVVEGIVVQCNWLINATGSTAAQSNSLKGVMNYRNDNGYVRGCEVYNCGSYAFWAVDDSTTGTLYCTGRYVDCYAKDFGVGFEFVNTRGFVAENCHAYVSGVLPIVPEAVWHTYGGSDMRLAINGCSGVSDGPVNSIFLALLTCKNVAINDSQFINKYDNGASVQAAVILEPSGSSDFDDINFNNCLLSSAYTSAVNLTIGSLGGVSNSINFVNCEIDGFGTGAALGGANGGRYSFSSCELIARASGVVTPIALQASNTPLSVQVTGGLAKASTTGSGVPTITNLSLSVFNGTEFDPVGLQAPRVKQRTVGRGTITGDGSTYATLQTFFNAAVSGWSSGSVGSQKVTATMTVDYGQSGGATFPAAVAMCYPYVYSMPSNSQVRFVMPQALQGKVCTYEITEWE